MKKALITAAGPNMAEVLSYSEPTFRKFADEHGYDLIINRDIQDGVKRSDRLTREAQWARIAMFKKYLAAYDLVVWMDADVMITSFDRDIADDMADDCFQGLVLEYVEDRFNPNTGVWAMRQGDQSRGFLAKVKEIGQIDHIWTDQAAVCTALGWELRNDPSAKTPAGFVKLMNPTEYMRATCWLPPEWNPLGLAAKWPSMVQHFAGLSNEERLPLMKALSQQQK